MLLSLARKPRILARVAGVLALAVLGGCTIAPNYYPRKSDAKPHPGVAKAQTYPIHGIDISRWQGEIDWDAVKDAGTKFVFMKATEGGDHMDPSFRKNYANARAAGLPVGAYHFVYWCRSAQEQAQWIAQNWPRDRDQLPPVLDVEWNGHSLTCPRKVPRDQALEMIRVLMAQLEMQTGKKPIIYTDITFHEDVLSGAYEDHPFWIRSVAAEPHQRYGERKWTFWQWTTTGRVPGIRGDVDRNVFNGTEKQFYAWLNANLGKDDEVAETSSIVPRGFLPF
ncbi:GH25 family lysozyme [uncultured Alsobacter sp.]|uniref:glycoside hydrolase family 25 protein n=1 Tax=uncultured Alsobacter sp. TaxID=1748258 RepID=UPI0025F2D283|nr:GH25 family lysozyme [uncultured Alsobacter sp.]